MNTATMRNITAGAAASIMENMAGTTAGMRREKRRLSMT